MPRLLLILSALLCFATFSQAQTTPSLNDTLNQTDSTGRKTGYWKIYGHMKPSLKGYPPEAVIEEGTYKASRKHGVWTKYYPNGAKKLEANYLNNRPNGAYKKYYDSGQLEEIGNWKRNRYIGKFERYYRSGCLEQEAKFSNGTATERHYYQDNCAISTGKIKGTSLGHTYNGTRMQKDSLGRKQGFWKQEEYYDGIKISSEGEFVSGKKHGLWHGWYSNKQKCYEVDYEMGVPAGWFVYYDVQGKKREQVLRTADGKSWEYYLYHSSIKGPCFTFPIDEMSMLSQLEKPFKDSDSLPDGFLRVSNSYGKIARIGLFENGKLKEGLHLRFYEAPCIQWYKEFVVIKSKECVPETLPPAPPVIQPPQRASSYKKLYNDDKQIWMDGMFRNGRLFSGKHYVYDSDGILLRIEIFKNGQYIGIGVIEE